MAQRSRFFDSSDGDRVYGSEAWAQTVRAIIGTGVVAGLGAELAVIEANPPAMSVRVGDGAAFILGYGFEVYGGPDTVVIAAANPTNPRIDRIVVRRSMSAREVVIAVLQGTPAGSPAPPALTESEAGTYEIPLAQVLVPASATSIVQANITDERGARAQGTDLATITDPDAGHRHDGTSGAGGGRKVRYTDLASVPATFPPSTHGHTGGGDGGTVAYSAITGKPSTFAPAAHDHTGAGEGGTIPYWAQGGTSPGARIFVGTSTPSGAVNGDVWIKG